MIEKSLKKWRCICCNKKLPWNDCKTIHEEEATGPEVPGPCPIPRSGWGGPCRGEGKPKRIPADVDLDEITANASHWDYYDGSKPTHQCGECGHPLSNHKRRQVLSRTYTGDRLPGFRGVFCNKSCAVDYALRCVKTQWGLPDLSYMLRTQDEKENGFRSHSKPWMPLRMEERDE